MKLTLRQRLLASTLLIGAAATATPAFAQGAPDPVPESPVTSEADPNAGQQDPGAEGNAGTGEEVIITGSRIPRRDLTSTSPLTVVQDEEFRLSGSANAEQVINALPQVIPTATAFSNNPGGGVATINLRGLGAQRNLVLVNGRRYIFYDANQVVDINTIPTFLIESTDVITGGASAVYGSDALAGVVNFRLRNDLEGVMMGGTYSLTEEGDGRRYNMYGAVGTTFSDGRGNVVAYGEYLNRGSIFQGQRSFSRFALADDDGVLSPGGSSNVPQGRFTAVNTVTVNGVVLPISQGTNFVPTAGPLPAGAFFESPGVSRPFVFPDDTYNYAPSNYLMVPQKRWTIGGYGEYEIADGVRAYGEVAFINNQVANELAATPIGQQVNVNVAQVCTVVSAADCAQLQLISQRQLAARAAAVAAGVTPPFGAVGAGTGTVPALGAGQARITANYRVTQISNRIAADDRNAYRMLAGVRGEIVENLNYDVSYMLARTKNAQVQTGNVSRSAFATNVGNGTCNVFGANLLSDQCITNISITAQNQEESRLQVAQASISGSLFQIPSATSAVGFAAGVEYRKMAAEFIPDTALSSGDVVGFNAGLPTEGAYDAKEVFGELRVPIVNEGFLHKFELNAAARYSDYSLDNVGGVPAYAVGAELAPIRDVTFRAQYQRAVRAPNVQELFGGTSVGFPPATDPCSSRNPVANRTEELRQLCIATGVPAANVFGGIQPNAQIEGLFGGNPDLQEEVGDTYTGGVILRPSFIPRLNLAVDYYRIRVKNAISPAGGGVGGILDLCYNIVADASSPICSLISRDPSGIIAGPPFIVTALNANLSSLTARGVDTQLDYTMPLGMGLASPASRLNFYVFGSYTLKNGFTRAPGDPGIDCEGRFGLLCGNPTPKWKHTARVSWLDGPVTTSLRWRFLGKVKDDDDQTDYVVERIKSYSLFDLTFGVDVTDQATLNFGVNNLFDKKPPIIGDNQEQSNTYPSAYDVIGRDFFVSAAFRF